MTDMAPGLGATASCPNCGAQVQVTSVDTDEVRCPDCGEVLTSGMRDEAATDVNVEEVIRAFGLNGYDTEVETDADGALRCTNCGTATVAGDWQVHDLRHGSTFISPSSTEGVVAALVCPSCDALAYYAPDVTADTDRESSAAIAALEDTWSRRSSGT